MTAPTLADLEMRDHVGSMTSQLEAREPEFTEPNLACAVAIERVQQLQYSLCWSAATAGQLRELLRGLDELAEMVRRLSMENARYSILYGTPGDAADIPARAVGEPPLLKAVLDAVRALKRMNGGGR